MTMPNPRGNSGNLLYNPGAIYTAPLATAEPSGLTGAWPSGWRASGYTDAGSQFDYQLQTAEIKVEEELDVIANATTGRQMTVRFALAEVTATNIDVAYNGGSLVSPSPATTTLATPAITAGQVVTAVHVPALAAGVEIGGTVSVTTSGNTDTFICGTAAVTSDTSITVIPQTAIFAHSISDVVTIVSGLVSYEPPPLGAETRLMLGYESEDGTVRGIFRRCLNVGNVATAFKRAPQKAILPVEFRLEKPAGVNPFRFLLAERRVA